MSPVEFSTLLAGWCEKHHFSNQRAAAAELGVSYGTLCGWLSRVRGLPCRLTRAAVLRRMLFPEFFGFFFNFFNS